MKPFGIVEQYVMKTMDVEEFLWANGYSDSHLDFLRECVKEKKPLGKGSVDLYHKLFLSYICVGGFPSSVSRYLENHSSFAAYKNNQDIIKGFEADFGRRVGEDFKPVFSPKEASRIRSAFELVPTYLTTENKRDIISHIGTKSEEDSQRKK